MTRLHVAYGNALIAARGYAAPETTAAFAAARNSASGEKMRLERLAADYGLWAHSYVQGELPSMRAHAAAFLRGVEARPHSPEAGVAQRVLGTTLVRWRVRAKRGITWNGRSPCLNPGEMTISPFVSDRTPASPRCSISRSPRGISVSLIARFRSSTDADADRGLTHVGTLALGRMHAAIFEVMRGDFSQAAPNASEIARLAREHDLAMWRPLGVFLEGWTTSESGAPADGLEDMRRGGELIREQNVLLSRASEDRAGRGRSAGRRSRPRRCDPRRGARVVRPDRLPRVRRGTASRARRNVC